MKRLNSEDLVIVDTLDQDSEEWLEWRGEGIGSSDVALLMNPEPLFDRTVGTLWKQKIGYERAVAINNEHVKRGKDLEPKIRDMVNEKMKTNFQPVCMMRTDAPYLRASLDGWDSEIDALLEIKSPSDKVFEKYLKTWEIPQNYWYQIQYQLMVTNAEYALYAFYNEQHPEPYIIHVENDHTLQLDIERRCALFWKGVETKTPVGWDGDVLTLFYTRPTLFVVIGGHGLDYSDFYVPVLRVPQTVKVSAVALITDGVHELIKWKDLNPEHDVKVISLEPSPFASEVVQLGSDGLLGHLKTLV